MFMRSQAILAPVPTKGSLRSWQLSLPGGQYTLIALVSSVLLVLVSLGCVLIPSPLAMIGCFGVLVIGIVALLRPRFALLLLFIGAGLPSITLALPGHNMHLVEPITVLLFLVIMVQRPSVRFSVPHLLGLLFIGLAIVSFIHVPEVASGSGLYGADKRLIALLIIFAAFFAGTWLADSIEDGMSFLVAILLVSTPLYCVGLAQTMGIHLSPLLESPDAYNPQMTQGRLWGPFPWSVNFGMYLVNLMAVAVVCWLQGTRRGHRMIGLVMTIATALEIVGSGTRSAACAAIVVVIVACLMCKRGKILSLSLLLAGIMGIPFFNKLVLLFSHDASSTDNRLLLWGEAIKLITANPWLGIGLQQFHYYYAQLIVGKATELDPTGIHPHEQYLEWAVESGILWCIVGVLLLLSIMLACWRAYHILPNKQKGVLLVALLAVLGNCIIGFVDVPFDQLEGATFLFALAGLALGLAGNIDQEPPTQSIWPAMLHRSPSRHPPKGTSSTTLRDLSPEKVGTPIDYQYVTSATTVVSSATSAPAAIPTSAEISNVQKTSRSVLTQLLSWGIAVPLIFPMTALLTRYLGPTQYGEYSLTLPFLTVFALLSGTGMDPLIIRQLSRQPRGVWSETLSYAVGTRAVSTLLSTGLALITAWLLPISAEQRSLFLIGSFSLLFSFSFNGLRIIYSHGFRAEQRVGLLALLETSNRIITAGLIALIVWQRYPLLWAYVLLIYSDLPMFLIQLVLSSKRYGIRIRFSLTRFREHMRTGLPLLGHNALTLLTGQIDICVLMIVSGPAIAGIYALASRIVDPLISIAFAYVNGLYPLLCTSFDEGHRSFDQVCYKATRLLALGIVPLAVCLCTQASILVNVLGGQRFAAAIIAVQLLMWAMVCTFFNQLGERICTAANIEHKVPMVTTVSATVNFVLNVALVPHWQILGASLTALVSEAVGLSLFAVQLRQHISLWSIARMLCLIVLSNLPSLALLLWQHHMPLLLSLPLALLLTLAGYFTTRTLSFQDLKLIYHLVLARSRGGSNRVHSNGQVQREQQWHLADQATLILPRVHI
jgi:O-antigen/teichoic acid export membrane protein/O-antigen ligase